MMKRIAILPLFLLLNLPLCFGQAKTIYRTTKKQHLHYIEMTNEIVKVYKMGAYFDKAGYGSAILKTDTLYKLSENEFKGRFYSLSKQGDNFILNTDKNKKLSLERETDLNKVNLELNNAYYLKSYFDLSTKLNEEFPLNHYTFRNGYYGWKRLTEKNYDHDDFIAFTDNEIKIVYDSISKNQVSFTNTSNFIKENARQFDYSQLKDSLKTLPVEFSPESKYFSQSVYNIVKANPESFYKILEDFPSNKTIIYFAVDEDKELIKQLKKVKGYDGLKKEFIKEYRSMKSMPYQIIGIYVVLGGLLTWLILNQK